jgi:hypothetical protein
VLKKPGSKPPQIELKNDRFARVRVIDSGNVPEELARL